MRPVLRDRFKSVYLNRLSILGKLFCFANSANNLAFVALKNNLPIPKPAMAYAKSAKE